MAGLNLLCDGSGIRAESVHLVTNRDTGRSRGFALVEMAEGNAEQAIAALKGTSLGGHTLNVNEARPKPAGAAGASRGVYGGVPGRRREPWW